MEKKLDCKFQVDFAKLYSSLIRNEDTKAIIPIPSNSDVIFICYEEKKVGAHKFLLHSASAKFAWMFDNNNRKNYKIDATYEAFIEFRQFFLYR